MNSILYIRSTIAQPLCSMNGRREWVWGEREEREKRENREREEEFHEFVRVARPGWLIVNERWKKSAKEGDREWNVERERGAEC